MKIIAVLIGFLLSIFTQQSTTPIVHVPIVISAISTTTSSLAVSYKKETKKISIPVVAKQVPEAVMEPSSTMTINVVDVQENNTPIISSVDNGTISGKNFTNTTSVYMYSSNLGEVGLRFTILNDETINLQSTGNSYATGGQYNLFVVNSYGASSPFQIIARPSTLGVIAGCQEAQQNLQSFKQEQINELNQQNQNNEQMQTSENVLSNEISNSISQEQIACQ